MKRFIENLSNTSSSFVRRKLSERQILIILSVMIGIVAALVVFMFEGAVEGIKSRVLGLSANNQYGNVLLLVLPVVGIIIVTLFVKNVLRDDISHGVTKVLKAISQKYSKIKSHNTFSSMVAGAITIGFGGSVGPEAPIVMTGSAIGSNFGKFFGLNHRQTTILLGCGAAAALAAIFKAPITGVVFVIEVLMIDMAITSIIPILIAAVTATLSVYFLHDSTPVFSVILPVNAVELDHIPSYLILAVFCGLISSYIIFSSAKIEGFFKTIKKQYVKWIIGGVVLGVLIYLFPPLYGQGYESITNLLQDNKDGLFTNSLFTSFTDNTYVLLGFLASIIIFKSVAMACTNGAGGVGGVFAPSIFLGAFSGYFIATLMNTMFGLDLPVVCFALVGMAGVMSGAMDAPLTSIFLIAEITGGYKLFVPLMLVSAISFGISYYFAPYSVYTRELVMKGDKISLTKERSLLYLDINKLIESNFCTIHEMMTLGDLVEVVSNSQRNLYPVVDESRKLLGYVTLDDIRKDMFNKELYNVNSVKDYVCYPPEVITTEDNIGEILDKFDKSNSWNLPVVEKETEKYIGFVSKSKIFSEYRQELQN